MYRDFPLSLLALADGDGHRTMSWLVRTTRTTSARSRTGIHLARRRRGSTDCSRCTRTSCPTLHPSFPSTPAVSDSFNSLLPPLPPSSADRPALRRHVVWDLAFFGRQDRALEASTEAPLDHQRVRWWQARMTAVLERINETWPGVPIWVRKLHRVGPVAGKSCQSLFLYSLPSVVAHQAICRDAYVLRSR